MQPRGGVGLTFGRSERRAADRDSSADVPRFKDELIDVIYTYYPRGVSGEDPERAQTEEARRLVEARRSAGINSSAYLAMVRRLEAHFPGIVSDTSVHLLTGSHDACYSGAVHLPTATGEHRHTLKYRVSILAPYYIVYSSRVFDDLAGTEGAEAFRATPPRTARFFVHDTMYVLPAGMVKAELREPDSETKARRQDIRFDFAPDEQPCAARIVQEIESTWGYQRMPPEVGRVIVPDVSTDVQPLGEATLYDCLFTDNW